MKQKAGINKYPLIILTLALLLRIFFVFTMDERYKIPTSDAAGYDELAVNILSGHGLSKIKNGIAVPTSERTPMYPLFLAGIYSVFGHNYLMVRVIQSILGSVLCVIIYFIARAIFGKTAAIIASLMAVFYKPFISYLYYGGPGFLLSENLYIFLLAMTVLGLIHLIKKENRLVGSVTGICMGLTILTRADIVLFPIVLAGWLFYLSGFSIEKFFKKYSMFFLFLIVTMSPWVVRNYMVHNEFVALTTATGITFWSGNNLSARGGFCFCWPPHANTEEVKNFSETELQRWYFKMAFKDLAEKPGRIPKLLMKKIIVCWAPFRRNGVKIFNGFYASILLLGLVGMWVSKVNPYTGILLILFLVTTLNAMIICGEPRYRYPVEPYLIIYAAVGSLLVMNKLKFIFRKKLELTRDVQ